MRIVLLVSLLILANISLKAQTLQDAIKAKDTDLARILIIKGENVNEVNAQGSTMLMEACHFPELEIAAFLLRHGAMIDQPRSPKGRTALMVACAYWSGLDMVKLLLEYHPDVNAVSNDGTTALMLAAQFEKLDVVNFLLQHGANAKMKNKAGLTALDLAKNGKVEDYMIKGIKDTRFDKAAVIASLEAAL